jgi:hypothetical protein
LIRPRSRSRSSRRSRSKRSARPATKRERNSLKTVWSKPGSVSGTCALAPGSAARGAGRGRLFGGPGTAAVF